MKKIAIPFLSKVFDVLFPDNTNYICTEYSRIIKLRVWECRTDLRFYLKQLGMTEPDDFLFEPTCFSYNSKVKRTIEENQLINYLYRKYLETIGRADAFFGYEPANNCEYYLAGYCKEKRGEHEY